MILAIDTSGATASVAIYEDQVLAELTWHSGRKHSAQLLPAIEQALALAQVDKQSLSAIGVAIGPGSYSGLRVGVSTAMAMALALDRPVAQVPTLDVITWSQACPHQSSATTARGMLVRAAIDVGRGRFASARIRAVEGQLEHESDIENVALHELGELAAREHSVLAVDLDPQSRQTIEQEFEGRVELAGPAACARRAGFLAELAAIKMKRGELVGDEAVEPIYLRN